MNEMSGPLLPLVTAVIAALVALRIASFNARRNIDRETIAELRVAYANWGDAIGEIATSRRNDEVHEEIGWTRSQTIESVTNEAERHVYAVSKVNRAASRVRVLDAALPREFDLIIGVLDSEQWNPELGVKPEHENLYIAASRCADELMERVAMRLNSGRPFRAAHSGGRGFEL